MSLLNPLNMYNIYKFRSYHTENIASPLKRSVDECCSEKHVTKKRYVCNKFLVCYVSYYRNIAFITCVSQAQGPQFDPGRKHFYE